MRAVVGLGNPGTPTGIPATMRDIMVLDGIAQGKFGGESVFSFRGAPIGTFRDIRKNVRIVSLRGGGIRRHTVSSRETTTFMKESGRAVQPFRPWDCERRFGTAGGGGRRRS